MPVTRRSLHFESRPSPPATRRGLKRQRRGSTPEDASEASEARDQQPVEAPRALPKDVISASPQAVEMDESVHEDDLCPICQLLLCHPVITRCNHVLCKSCMATWADVSLSRPMTIVSVDEEATEFDAVSGLEARCPMCRTHTAATLDEPRENQLRAKYPTTYARRENEEVEDAQGSESIQTITVYIGNRHKRIDPREDSPHNKHEWTFFIKSSRTDIIEEVQVFLHPTFRPSHIIRQRAPYEIKRLGWGVFNIIAAVILKAGYSWVSEDAEDSPDGAPKGMLRLEWMLDFESFDGTGAMGRCRFKVKNDRNWQDISDEEERDEAEWNRTIRQYQQDGNYVPPPEE